MKAVMVIAVPLMLQQLISVSVNLVDNLMVGYLGDHALSGVAAVNRYYMVANCGVLGIASAAAVFIAQYYGAGNYEKVKESFRIKLLFTFSLSFVFTLLAYFGGQPILRFFTNDEAVIAEGLRYIRIVCFSYVPSALSISIYSAMRSVGEMKVPLRCSTISVALNAVLNYLLIFGVFGLPAMGVAGAALATLIARIIEVLLALLALKSHSYPFSFPLSTITKISARLTKEILAKAAPLMVNELLWSSGMATLFKFYGTRGSEVLSGYSISGTIGDLFFTLFGGMAAATTVLVSTPLGADRIEEAKDNAYKLVAFSVLLAVVFGGMLFGSSFLVPILYGHVSPDAQEVAILFLRVQGLMFWNYMATTQCYFILRAGGDMKHTLMMDSGFMWTVNIPLVAIVTYLTPMPYIGLCLMGQFTDLLKLLIAQHLVRKEAWAVNLTS